MFRRSPSTASSASASISLATGRLSPVSAASAVCSATDWITRASAAIVSPSSMSRMSPGTTSAARIERRAGLLHVAENRIEQHDREDRDGFVGKRGVALDEPERRGDCGGDEEQQHQRVDELLDELAPGRHGLASGKLVSAVLAEP